MSKNLYIISGPPGTNHFTEEQLPEIISEIVNNEKYRVK